MPPAEYARLLDLVAEVADLERAAAVLEWDQHTYMPPGGAAARGEQLATLRRLAHLRATAPEVGELLDGLLGYEQSLPRDSDEASMVRTARREYEKAVRVPADLVAEHARAAAAGHRAWLEARAGGRFDVFRPALERLVEVMRQVADALGHDGSPLDALIDLWEPGVTAAACETLFSELRQVLVPLAREVAGRSCADGGSLFRQAFAPDRQLACGLAAVRAIGFDPDQRGRVDQSVHPFTISFAVDDTRITTRIDPGDFGNCFFSLLHEAGHGLYEQGLPRRLDRTVLGRAASAGLHESQSRLWENLVGRSREFWQFFLPRAAGFFPDQFGRAHPDDVYRAVNRVAPSLIRTEADEVTYNLHVMLRFDLEKDVLEGRLAVADLRDAWNRKMEDYLGIVPPDDVRGVLQDIHWSGTFGGAFQGYTLGNVMAGQLYAAARADHPGLQEELAGGRFAGLFQWMREKVHEQGAKFEPLELIERATGRPLSAGPYLAYLEAKYGELLGL